VGGLVLLLAFVIAWRRRDGMRGPVFAATAFGLLALCLIVPVSRIAGRPTFGETGRLNQLWYVNSAPYAWSLCIDPAGILPLTRAKTVRTDPVIARAPLTCTLPDQWEEATLPLWYDPSWWYRDTRASFDVRETLHAVRTDVRYIRESLADAAPWLSIGVLIAAVAALATWSPAGVGWPLLLIAAGATTFYLLVYVELRHVSPFFVLGTIATLLALLGKSGRWRTWLLVAITVAGFIDVSNHASQPALVELAILRHELRGDPRPGQTMRFVARELARRGLQPGDRLAAVATLWNVDWAQRGGFVVRAFVPEYSVNIVQLLRDLRDPCAFLAWTEALRRARIDAAVFLVPNGFRAPDTFEPLGDTGYYLLRLGRGGTPPACRAG
jgi:hypothetical protein